MSSANRSDSPITEKITKKRLRKLVLGDHKIHRVRLASEAVVRLANLTSANCMWFKLKDDITDQLQYVKPAPLDRLLDDKSSHW
uniref:Uncharacterized protein n=1 Tax=Ditylenchus dipsaci TaxID=166011 RepID=A0A915E6F4_9BILA